MKIAFATYYDPAAALRWRSQSGRGFGYFASGAAMSQALKDEGINISTMGPLPQRNLLLYIAKQAACRLLKGRRHLREVEPAILRGYAETVQSHSRSYLPDVILSHGILPVARLDSSIPIVLWTDAPLAGILNYYPHLKNLCPASVSNLKAAERDALQRASLIIYSSSWAARTAREMYGIPDAKICVIPLGANLIAPRRPDEIKTSIRLRSKTVCKLLFMGVDWERKGGDIAVETAKLLNQRGIPTELVVTGCRPSGVFPPFIKILGFVNRSTPEGGKIHEQLMAESHFLILPSRADCTPGSIREALARGLPCFSTETGGIGDLVKDGINGRLFQPSTPAESYAAAIEKLWADRPGYESLCLSSFEYSESHLSWKLTAKKIIEKIITACQIQ